MQLFPAADRTNASFSILLRIVELAVKDYLDALPVWEFQYPLADRRACGR